MNLMKTLYLNIADCIIRIIFHESEYAPEKERLMDAVTSHYSGFVMESPPAQANYTVHCVDSTSEIVFFNPKNGNGYMFFYHKKSRTIYETYYYASIFQIQSLLFEILRDWLDRKNGFIMHASGNLIRGKAVLFLGKSGAGKSTITTLLSPRFPSIASDTVIIVKVGRRFYAYQTPFFEKETWVRRMAGKLPLEAVYFIHKAQECRIGPAPSRETVIKKLIAQVMKHGRREEEMVRLVMQFASQTSLFHNLYFTKEAGAIAELFAGR